ncbi:MAG: DNA-formamidopyrimidine glycosylase family protein [Acidimicrobiales bacterium]
MPELIEVETYRRRAEAALFRTIGAVDARDAWFLKHGTSASMLEVALVGRSFVAARRIGKLLLLDTGPLSAALEGNRSEPVGPTLGLRFGMTGRVVLDGTAAIDRLEYASGRDRPVWDRFSVRFADGGVLRLQDPRRLGGVELDPDEGRLGVDALGVGSALRAAGRKPGAPQGPPHGPGPPRRCGQPHL